MVAAPATASSRFFGLTPASTTAKPSAAPRLISSIRPIHFGIGASSPSRGRPRNWRTATSSSRTPRTILTQLTQVAGLPDWLPPPGQERGTVDSGPGGGEHQHDRDDGNGADGDPDRQRQRSSDGLAHHPSFPDRAIASRLSPVSVLKIRPIRKEEVTHPGAPHLRDPAITAPAGAVANTTATPARITADYRGEVIVNHPIVGRGRRSALHPPWVETGPPRRGSARAERTFGPRVSRR